MSDDIALDLQLQLNKCIDRRFANPRIQRVNAKHVPVELLERALNEIIILRNLYERCKNASPRR